MPKDPPPAWALARRREIGLRIGTIRQALGLSVDAIAEASGLNRKTIMSAEQARNATGIDALLRIADALDVPAARLFEQEPWSPE